MAISYVKEVGQRVANLSSSPTSTPTLTVSAAPGAGNLLILRCATPSWSVSSVTDSKGNTWFIANKAGAAVSCCIAYTFQNVAALTTSDTITITMGGNISLIAASVDEFSGVASFDGSNKATLTSTTARTSLSVTLASPNELIYACYAINVNGETLTPDTGYTALPSYSVSAANVEVEGQYRIVSAGGTYAPNGTGSLTASGGGVMATFVAAGATPRLLAPAISGIASLTAKLRQRFPNFAIQGVGSLTAALGTTASPTPTPTGAGAILKEDGSGRILLEDSSGVLLLESGAAPPAPPPSPPPGPIVSYPAFGRFAPSTTYLVEVAWGMSWASGGLFTFGTSRFGGSDVFSASSWSGSFNVPYGNLTGLSRRIQIVRGRDDLLSNMQGGTMTLDLSDPQGLLNTRNPSSPLYGTLYTGVPVRVSAYTTSGLLVPLYYGFVNTITSDPGGRYGTAQLTATDFFTRLDKEKPNLGVVDGLTTGSLIGRILDVLGWIDPALRALDVGDVLPNGYPRADGTRTALALIEEALQVERGYFFVAGDGTVTYLSRYRVLTAASETTIDRTMTSAPSTLDDSRIVNRWTVTRTDPLTDQFISGGQTAAVDPTTDLSYRRYHYIDGGISSPLLVDDNQALALAQYMLATTKNPSGVGWQVPLNPADSATLDQMLVRDLGDRVTMTVAPLSWPAYSRDFSIQQIKHDISTEPGAARHVTTWGLAEVPPQSPFRFGVSQFGGPDVLVY